ncbi:unnamed protein product [Hyaloperonospora brassicae]|uniref:RxLR effector candidate protein n=1 Tax=Hyaloperonospora brassicae TaxID=162125 RepID=A0AAV0TD10_HYABA|nr:unnamed protein product [Hyaloperonospora brassicae]
MRFDFIAVVAVTAIVVHLKILRDVCGLPTTSVDGRGPASDHNDVVFVHNSFIDLGGNNSEERLPSAKVGQDILWGHLNTISYDDLPPILSSGEDFLKRGYNLVGKASTRGIRGFLLRIQRRYTTWYKSEGKIRRMLDKLMELAEHTNIGARPVASNLLDSILMMYVKDKVPIDEFTRFLQLFYTTYLVHDVDFLRINVLRRYIKFFNEQEGTDHTLIETLTENHGARHQLATALEIAIDTGIRPDDATQLREQMMEGWKKEGLNSADVFTKLKLDDRILTMFGVPKFKAYERYAREFMKEDLLDALVQRLGGENRVAEYAMNMFVESKDPRAQWYINALLRKWKDVERIDPANLIELKFTNVKRSSFRYEWSRDIAAVYAKFFRDGIPL